MRCDKNCNEYDYAECPGTDGECIMQPTEQDTDKKQKLFKNMSQLDALYIARDLLDEHLKAGSGEELEKASIKLSEIINRYRRKKYRR